jgi:hypothetical protein
MIRVLFLVEITTTELLIIACLNANSASPAVLVVIRAVTDLGFRCRSDENLLVPLYTRKTSFIEKNQKRLKESTIVLEAVRGLEPPPPPFASVPASENGRR